MYRLTGLVAVLALSAPASGQQTEPPEPPQIERAEPAIEPEPPRAEPLAPGVLPEPEPYRPDFDLRTRSTGYGEGECASPDTADAPEDGPEFALRGPCAGLPGDDAETGGEGLTMDGPER
jgi:hypothetical protein